MPALRSIDKLIFDIVEHRDERDFDELCDRLMSARLYVGMAEPQPGAPAAIQSAELDGRTLCSFYTSPEHPGIGRRVGAVQGPRLLRMVLKMGADGAILQNAQASWLILDRERIAHVLKTRIVWAASARHLSTFMQVAPGAVQDSTGTVPEGHKIVVFKPTKNAYLQETDSGVWLLGFGDGREPSAALDRLEELQTGGERPHVLWLLRADFIDSLRSQPEFLSRVSRVVSKTASTMTHHAVLSGRSALHEQLVRALQSIGVAVSLAADDGASFVEVHRPSGIVVGIPGPSN